jgi:hypothetical protein
MEERSAEILKRFEESWEQTEETFANFIDTHPDLERLIPVYLFIQKLRDAGNNQFYRLGTSLHHLIISRSANDGLRSDQKFISIEAFDDSFEVTLKDGTKMYRQYTIEELSDPSLVNLLETLKSAPID